MNKPKTKQGTVNLLGPSNQLYELIRIFLVLAGILATAVWSLKSYPAASRWIVAAVLFIF